MRKQILSLFTICFTIAQLNAQVSFTSSFIGGDTVQCGSPNPGHTGWIELQVYNDTNAYPPYQYKWSRSFMGPAFDSITTTSTHFTLTALDSGNYYVNITDAMANSVSASFVVRCGQLSIQISQTDSAICGNNNVSFTAANYPNCTYYWQDYPDSLPGNWAGATYTSNTANFTIAQPGDYFLTVTDTLTNASGIHKIHLNSYSSPALNLTSGNLTCYANNTGQIVAVSNGGLAPYVYNIDSSMHTNSVFGGLAAGNYNVVVTDAHGCKASGNVSVLEPSPITASFSITPDLQTSHHWFLTYTTSVTNPLSFNWQFGDGGSSALAYPSHNYSTPGYYNICLTVTDSNNCTVTSCDSSTNIYKTEQAIISVDVVAQIPTSIAKDIADKAIQIYPNPVTNLLVVEGLTEHTPVVITNLVGEELIKQISVREKTSIDVSSLSLGIYFINAKKFIKQL